MFIENSSLCYVNLLQIYKHYSYVLGIYIFIEELYIPHGYIWINEWINLFLGHVTITAGHVW